MEPGRTIRPIALEIIHNGRHLCTAGMRGNPGVLTAILHWVNRGRRDELDVRVGGLNLSKSEDLTWSEQAVAVGDEIVIRVIETMKVTRPKKRQKPLTREFVENQERAYLLKTAKKYGYKLVKS